MKELLHSGASYWVAPGEPFLRCRQQQDVDDWFMADLDWHNKILWLLLLSGERENDIVRLICIVIQIWNRNPQIWRQERGFCGTAWWAELALTLSLQCVAEEIDAAGYSPLPSNLGPWNCLLDGFQVPPCHQKEDWALWASSFIEERAMNEAGVVGSHLTWPVLCLCSTLCALHVS